MVFEIQSGKIFERCREIATGDFEHERVCKIAWEDEWKHLLAVCKFNKDTWSVEQSLIDLLKTHSDEIQVSDPASLQQTLILSIIEEMQEKIRTTGSDMLVILDYSWGKSCSA